MAKLIIANWKLNPRTEKEAVNLARSSNFKNVVIAPPFIFLAAVRRAIKKAALGAQDVFWENPSTGGGPYTGEVSAVQLKFLGVKYVIIGHSERRHWLQETDDMINKKVKTALKAGLKVVLCVGEPLLVRKKGLAAAKNFVKKQLIADLKEIRNSKLEIRNLLVAYEPVWAIGTGRSDNPQHTVEMAKFIKTILTPKAHRLMPKVLYGGSVTSKNAASFLNRKEIDGALVGGASLNAKEFIKIVNVSF